MKGMTQMVYKDLTGKVAVITGGSKGIGNAIAKRYGEEKMKVLSTTTLIRPVPTRLFKKLRMPAVTVLPFKLISPVKKAFKSY